MTGEGLRTTESGELELTDEQRAFSSFMIDSLGYSAQDAGETITVGGITASLQDGLGMCMDRIFAAGWDEAQIKTYADQLLAAARAGQGDAS